MSSAASCEKPLVHDVGGIHDDGLATHAFVFDEQHRGGDDVTYGDVAFEARGGDLAIDLVLASPLPPPGQYQAWGDGVDPYPRCKGGREALGGVLEG